MRTELHKLEINGRDLKGGDRIVEVNEGSLYFRRNETVDGKQYALFSPISHIDTVTVHRYVDVPWHDRDIEWVGLGKFSSEIDERVYEEFGMDTNETCGDVEITNYFSLVYFGEDGWAEIKGIQFPEVYAEDLDDPLENGDGFGTLEPIGAIIEADNRGFIGVEYFYDADKLSSEWKELEGRVNLALAESEDEDV